MDGHSMKFTVIANCQSGPMANLLMALAPQLKLVKIMPIHLLKTEDRDEFDRAIADVEIVIHQPISSNFREFAIDAVKERFPYKCYLSFPSLYFLGYSPWSMYLRKPTGGTLKGPIGDYHDERVVNAFINGLSVQEAIQRLAIEPLDTSFVDKELAKLEQREIGLDVCSVDYLSEHYRDRKLFYVMNHPSNEVMIHVCLQLLDKLGIVVDRECLSIAERRPDYLRTVFSPIDPAVRALSITATDDGDYGVVIDGNIHKWNTSEFITACFDYYSKVDDMPALYRFASARRIALGG
jgi:hypothetical protein